MKIGLVRVDDRLIHGQVVLGWTRTVGASVILVANDKVAVDRMQRSLLKMAAPSDVAVEILSVADAAARLTEQAWPGETLLVLVRDPVDLVRLADAGVSLSQVNVGNVRYEEGRIRITKEVAATPPELAAWKRLDQMGVALECQWLPGQAITRLNEIVRSMPSA